MSELHKRFLDTLTKTQWLPTERLKAYQDRLLSALVAHARATTPFYRDTGRLDCLFRADGTVDLARWQDVPVLTRPQIRAAGEALYAESWPKEAGEAHDWRTSGTTEAPMYLKRSATASVASACVLERSHTVNGIDGNGHLVQIRFNMLDNSVTGSGWRRGYPAGRLSTLGLGSSDLDPLVFLRDAKADYLKVHPGIAHEMARDIVLAGEPAVHFKAVMTFGETLNQEARTMIQQAFDAPVVDRYGCEEMGILASTCPAGAYHLEPETALFELVDDDGSPVPAGLEGRVVVTSFYNYAMPFVRYALGDRATLSPEPCRCGRSAPVLAHVAGRTRHRFRYRDGSTAYPILEDRALHDLMPFRRFQLVQQDLDLCLLRIEPRTTAPSDAAAVARYAESRLHPSVRVEVECVESVFPQRGGKRECYVSHLPDIWFGNPAQAPAPRQLMQPAIGPIPRIGRWDS